MRLVGDLRSYTQFQVAEAIPAAAANSGGVAGAGVGLGAGVAFGQTMASQIAGSTVTAASAAPDDPIALLERLHGLVTKGIISQAEFDTKKAELLSKIR
jgi:membrane protease subunit (stomatin/prohibitin family)